MVAGTLAHMASRSTSTPFVAREEQVAALAEALDRARAGTPGAVLVAADAGVGKTRLLRHVAERAELAGARAVVAHCVDLGEIGLPYLPFAEALAQLQSLAPEAVAAVAASRPALARLLPGGGQPADEQADDRSTRLQLFEGIVEVLDACSAEAPLLLVLEDLHWADVSSREVLRFVVSRLRAQRILLVGSYRTDDLHRRHPLRPLLAELTRHPRVVRLDLPPFTEAELAQFTVAVTGTALPEAELRSVVARSEGNAYFAEELLEADADGELPWSLGDVLRTRVEQLEPATQELVQVAAVGGRRVDERLLRAAVEAAELPSLAAPGAVDAALRDAITHHVLGVDHDLLAFRHALLAEAVYTDLLPGEQARLHRAYLRALQADPTLGPSSQLASHALRAPDLPVALRAAWEAARQAGELLAPAEELDQLEVVLRLWDAVPTGELEVEHVDVLAAATRAASNAGRMERAVQLARAAVEEPGLEPMRRAQLRTVLARHLLDVEDLEPAHREAAAAIDELPDETPCPARAWAFATYARTSLNLDLDEEALEWGRRAVDMARAVGALGAEADALTTLAVVSADDRDHAAELMATAVERAQAAGEFVTELRSRHNLASNRYYAGDLLTARRLAHEGLERARELGLSSSLYAAELWLFAELVRYTLGDLTPGGTPGVSDELSGALTAVSLYSAVARGDEDAVTRGRSLEPGWHRDGMIALVGGGCTVDALTWRGELDDAVDVARRAIAHLEKVWNDFFLGGIWLSALALAAIADAAEQQRLAGQDLGPLATAADEMLTRAVETARRGRPRGGRLGPEGRAWLARAHAEHGRALGGAANDPALWRAALDEFDYGYRYEVARTRYRLAESLLLVGERDEAREHAAQALAEADAMGAGPLADAVRSLGRRGRLALPGERTSSADVLTAREGEVLALVAQGLSNRQIGEQLFISGKTVSVHISNLLAKLGASGRAEAVSIAHQRGLIGTH